MLNQKTRGGKGREGKGTGGKEGNKDEEGVRDSGWDEAREERRGEKYKVKKSENKVRKEWRKKE